MTNEEYFIQLAPALAALAELRSQAIKLAAGMIGETLFSEDLFFGAAADRCIRLLDGFCIMLKERNLTCAGVLLRMQMDNCMRTYAAFIAEDKKAVVDCILNGDPIKNLKDKEGKKMTDGHLKDKVTELDKQFAGVYDQASGYVHLSEKAFFQTVEKVDDDGEFCFNYGHPLPEKRNDPLLESAVAYIHFVKLQFRMLQAVADSKQRYDAKEHNDDFEED